MSSLSSDRQPEPGTSQRWEARARVDFPLHYLIWLREHKLLEEKLDAICSNQLPTSQVSRVNVAKVLVCITPKHNQFIYIVYFYFLYLPCA